MSIELNHTIVHARDREGSAQFLGGILGLSPGAATGPFIPLVLSNGVTLDYMRSDQIQPQHYAFLVGEAEFDAAYAQLMRDEIPTWADPGHTQSGMNHRSGGRGVYFLDPNGHNMELLTKP